MVSKTGINCLWSKHFFLKSAIYFSLILFFVRFLTFYSSIFYMIFCVRYHCDTKSLALMHAKNKKFHAQSIILTIRLKSVLLKLMKRKWFGWTEKWYRQCFIKIQQKFSIKNFYKHFSSKITHLLWGARFKSNGGKIFRKILLIQ